MTIFPLTAGLLMNTTICETMLCVNTNTLVYTCRMHCKCPNSI